MISSALLALAAPAAVIAQLHSLAVDAGLLYWGTAVGNQATQDQAFMAIVNNVEEIGQLVPENGQKWEPTEPNRGQFSFEEGDVVANLAAQNGQILRCHTLVWYNQLPGWVSQSGFSAQELQEVIESHIANVMEHYAGQCYAWDVVNEAAADEGGYRATIFYDTLGTDYFAIAFNAAKAADADVKLYYNDYNLEYNAAKTDTAVEIVETIQAAGAPIDGVGFQGHLIVGETPSRENLATALKRFTSLGVEVAYTEVDIRHSSIPADDQGRQQQGDDYAAVVGSCLDVEGCIGFTVWGFSDKYSWVEGTFPGEGEACIYDSDLQPKPAWTSISSLLEASSRADSSEPTGESSTSVSATSSEPPISITSSGSEPPMSTATTNSEPPISTTKSDGEPSESGNTSDLEPTVSSTASQSESSSSTSTSDGEPPASSASSTTLTTFTTSSEGSVIPSTTGGPGDGDGAQAGQWEQCGGGDWPGPFECVSPFTCTVISDFYSQCN